MTRWTVMLKPCFLKWHLPKYRVAQKPSRVCLECCKGRRSLLLSASLSCRNHSLRCLHVAVLVNYFTACYFLCKIVPNTHFLCLHKNIFCMKNLSIQSMAFVGNTSAFPPVLPAKHLRSNFFFFVNGSTLFCLLTTAVTLDSRVR